MKKIACAYNTFGFVSYRQCVCHDVAGRPGQWLFHTSNRYCEGRQISYSYRCRRWYIREQYRYWNPYWFYYGYYYYYYYYYYYWNPFRRLRPCPCWWRQARWDWRYRVDWRTRCATHRFGFSTTTQVVLTVYLTLVVRFYFYALVLRLRVKKPPHV